MVKPWYVEIDACILCHVWDKSPAWIEKKVDCYCSEGIECEK